MRTGPGTYMVTTELSGFRKIEQREAAVRTEGD
jgi:hypothetical protein